MLGFQNGKSSGVVPVVHEAAAYHNGVFSEHWTTCEATIELSIAGKSLKYKRNSKSHVVQEPTAAAASHVAPPGQLLLMQPGEGERSETAAVTHRVRLEQENALLRQRVAELEVAEQENALLRLRVAELEGPLAVSPANAFAFDPKSLVTSASASGFDPPSLEDLLDDMNPSGEPLISLHF